MQRFLIVFATREGQTEKIARRVADHLQTSGHPVTLLNAADPAALETAQISTFDHLVFGGSIHIGHLEPELIDFLTEHQATIRATRHSLFVVLLSAATHDPAQRARDLELIADNIHNDIPVTFEHIEMIAGAIMYSKYSWPKKWIMRRIARQSGEETDPRQDYEYTDWEQVARFANALTT